MKIGISTGLATMSHGCFPVTVHLSLSSEKSEEELVQEERVAPRTWREISTELKAMMLCSSCALPAYDVENPVVLTCAHILCMKCLTEEMEFNDTDSKGRGEN